MFWIIGVFFVLMVLLALAVYSISGSMRRMPSIGKRDVYREAENGQADNVIEVWTSANHTKMLSQLDQKTTPVDRHFQLMNIINKTYQHRDNPKDREIFYKVSKTHIDEFPHLIPALQRFFEVLPRVPTFQQYSTVLTEDGRFDEAILICQNAIEFGLHDGTKTGFEGRIERIKKKQEKSNKK